MNFNVSRSLKTAKSVITANSPVLLVGAAVAGVVATGVLAAKGGYKARIIDEAESERNTNENPLPPLTTTEKVKLTWLCYAPAVLTGVGSIASCLGVHLIHTKRHAALVGLYAMTANKLDDYKDKAEELLGTKKTQQLNDSLAQKWLDENPIDPSQITVVEGGTQLMLDMWTQRPFMSTMNKIDAAVNECNAMLIDEGDLDLNIFYDRIGLANIPQGGEMGWSGKDRLNITYGSAIDPNGRAVITLSFRQDPKPILSKR
jgi:hypothetical protein